MTMTLRQIPTEAQELATFKQAMRHLVGGVSVITAGSGGSQNGTHRHVGALALARSADHAGLRQSRRVSLARHPA